MRTCRARWYLTIRSIWNPTDENVRHANVENITQCNEIKMGECGRNTKCKSSVWIKWIRKKNYISEFPIKKAALFRHGVGIPRSQIYSLWCMFWLLFKKKKIANLFSKEKEPAWTKSGFCRPIQLWGSSCPSLPPAPVTASVRCWGEKAGDCIGWCSAWSVLFWRTMTHLSLLRGPLLFDFWSKGHSAKGSQWTSDLWYLASMAYPYFKMTQYGVNSKNWTSC